MQKTWKRIVTVEGRKGLMSCENTHIQTINPIPVYCTLPIPSVTSRPAMTEQTSTSQIYKPEMVQPLKVISTQDHKFVFSGQSITLRNFKRILTNYT